MPEPMVAADHVLRLAEHVAAGALTNDEAKAALDLPAADDTTALARAARWILDGTMTSAEARAWLVSLAEPQ